MIEVPAAATDIEKRVTNFNAFGQQFGSLSMRSHLLNFAPATTTIEIAHSLTVFPYAIARPSI